MAGLMAYHWPGNVRELEHCIERAVILSQEPELQPPLAALPHPRPSSSAVARAAHHAVTLRDAEREHILRTLEETRWVISGSAGAAGVDRPYGGLGGKPKPALRAPIGMVRSGDAVAIMDFHEVRLEHGGIKVGM